MLGSEMRLHVTECAVHEEQCKGSGMSMKLGRETR